MAIKNRYSLEDIQDLINLEGSPLSEYYLEKPNQGDEGTARLEWNLLWGHYDDAIKEMLDYTQTACMKQLKRVLFSDIEEVPLHINKPDDCEERLIGNCKDCELFARWRLTKGK